VSFRRYQIQRNWTESTDATATQVEHGGEPDWN
jgi:hypothetical protein